MSLRAHTLALIAAGGLVAAVAHPQAAASAARPLDIAADVTLVPGGGAILKQRGTFSGSPLGKGTVTLRTTIGAGSGATFSFEMFNARGRVHGSGDVALDFKGSTIIYHGTAKITKGRGAFRTLRARRLRVSGSGPLSGETFHVALAGPVTG
jgi:hypothetical protein